MISGSNFLSTAVARGLYGLNQSNSNIASSSARLASGIRLQRAADDVAALSIAARMNSQLSGLRQAQQNAIQGDSMLQIAADGASQISDILTRMQALSVQAGSGALTNNDRAYLNTEFQALRDEIDRIAGTTNFNNINLLDGTLSPTSYLNTETAEATEASGSLSFTANVGGGEDIELNGVSFTEGIDFNAGASINDTLNDLADAINTSTDIRVQGVTANVVGNTLTLTAKAGGAAGNQFIINEANSSAAARFSVSGASTNLANVFTLQGGSNDGLYAGSTRATGTIGDSVITAQSQTPASATLAVTSIANGETLTLDDGNGGNVTFTFTTAAPATPTQIQIVSGDIGATLQNAIDVITDYSETNTANDNYGLRQLEFERDGNSLIIRNRLNGNPTDLAAAALNVGETIAGATLSATTLNNGTATGVDTTGITEPGFTGTISGFSATYNSNNNVTLEITVGDTTYAADITDTSPGSDTTVRFSAISGEGGYFDVQLDGGSGSAVANQTDADAYAARFDAAFSTLTFDQTRFIEDFQGVGDLAGSTLEVRLSDFSNRAIDSVEVTAPSVNGGSARIEITIDGEIFRSDSSLGDSIGAGELITLTSTTNGNRSIALRQGDQSIDLSDADAASDFQADLRMSLGMDATGEPTEFRIGPGSQDTIRLNIGNLGADRLFGGQSLNLSTTGGAEDAADAIGEALVTVQSTLAEIGAAQERFVYAQDALSSQINEIDIARAAIEDTDIAAESIALALATVQSQSAIAVIAQTRNMANSMLELLRVQ